MNWLFGPNMVYCDGSGPCQCISGCVDWAGILAMLIGILSVFLLAVWVAWRTGVIE